MWKCLNKTLLSKASYVPDVIDFHGKLQYDKKEICNEFNNYFVDSIIEINSKIPVVNDNELNLANCKSEFKFKMVEMQEIWETAKELTNKVNKQDYCNSIVWYDAMEYIAFFMKEIINESLYIGIVPDIWKLSTITPIPKIKNTIKASDFRPINSMPVDEKIIEKIVKKQLIEYIDKNDIIYEKQSAFRKNHSCETTINYVLKEFIDATDDADIVIAVFIDLKRAFETVDRQIMLKKLIKYGIYSNELKWFESFLSNRKQKTKYLNEISYENDIPIGLPQGTALSVILFNLYINDITSKTKYSKIVLFADDTLIMVRDKKLKDAITKVNFDLMEIYKWLNFNKLSLNVNKTKWMLVNRSKKEQINSIDVSIGDYKIDRVNSIKYLGIILDEKLNFDEQVNELVKNVACKVNFLKRISNKCTYDIRKLIFNSIISPHFEYCSTIYMKCNNEQIKQIQKIHSRAMRTVLKCDYLTSRKVMLNTLNWLSFHQRVKLNSLISVYYKMKNEMIPQYLIKKLSYNLDIHDKNLRNRDKLRLPKVKNEKSKHNLFNEGIKLFNDLPDDIRNTCNFNEFKRKCSNYVKSEFSF